MHLVRYTIRPASPWLTPWRADTLAGMLACQLVLEDGPDEFRRLLGEPWARGDPPFVLSDAFPGELLPAPACLGLFFDNPGDRKRVKRTAWLDREQFRRVQAGERPVPPAEPSNPLRSFVRMRNAIDRAVSSTGTSGTLYSIPATCLNEEFDHLTLYARVREDAAGLLQRLIESLAQRGFGADTTTGSGQFSLGGPAIVDGALDNIEGATGWISLSTFQPGPADPVEGFWRIFVKYGRLGPLAGADAVFKRPQWMMEPGACFRTKGIPKPWYGTSIPTGRLLAPALAARLAESGIAPIQSAFALAVPMRWNALDHTWGD